MFPIIRISRLGHARPILVLAIIVVIVTGFFSAAYTFHWFGLATINCWNRPANVPANSAYFVVVAANEALNVGFNGSKYHSGPWPMLNVTLGQNVWIHFVNNDSIQPHSLAIVSYFNRGLILGPGQCGDVTFAANQIGSFRIYCFIDCTIHAVMQNGKFNVNQ